MADFMHNLDPTKLVLLETVSALTGQLLHI
jgi:hypothetical protein